ncbi:hypothetical protein LB823_10180 [Tsukamurella sp. M9C]|uniref:hypothetical protein n=1 Tax=unclassified Tsukamurella TaxID=2633480 RepID=UPI001CC9A678|nr:hypothetical protein [Tsukamurella sp. M9C]MCA0156568.1 hypothetical protein [Tsukamurella sp. M9C]
MVRKHSTAMIASIAALVLVSAGCSNDSNPASTTSSATPSSSAAATHHQAPATGQPGKPVTGNGGNAGPTRTVTQPPGPAHTVTKPAPAKPGTPDNGGTYDVPCTGPDQGTVCTNPNHGAGDDPNENGTAPTTTPKVRDDDPGGKPCTTGMGVAGTYVYSDDTNSWVCQIG